MLRGHFCQKKQDVFVVTSWYLGMYTLEDWHETYKSPMKKKGRWSSETNLQGIMCNMLILRCVSSFFVVSLLKNKCFSVDCNRTRTVSALHLSFWQCSTTMSMFHGCPHVPQKGQFCCKWGWFLERTWGHYHVVAIFSEYANEIRSRYISILIMDMFVNLQYDIDIDVVYMHMYPFIYNTNPESCFDTWPKRRCKHMTVTLVVAW